MKRCPVCDGDGEIQGEVDYDGNDIPVWNLEKCPQCKGTGKVEENGGAILIDKFNERRNK